MAYQKQLEQLNEKYQELFNANLDYYFGVVGLDYTLREFLPEPFENDEEESDFDEDEDSESDSDDWWDTRSRESPEERQERKEQDAKKRVLWFKGLLREMDYYLRQETYEYDEHDNAPRLNGAICKWREAADYIQAQFDSATELRPSKPTKSAGMVATLH